MVKCKVCGKSFYGKPCHIKMGYCKYCSKDCSNRAKRTGKLMRCGICGKEIWRTKQDFRRSKSGKFFCSKKCQTLWRNKKFSGKLHPNWKNGNNRFYREKLLKSDRERVCVRCGNGDLRVLVVHHIDGERKNSRLTNLMWLCRNCHYLIHLEG